jgi:hypothetical protein
MNELLGKTVVSAVGTYVGEIYDIGVAPSTWALACLYVKLSNNAIKVLGLKKNPAPTAHQSADNYHSRFWGNHKIKKMPKRSQATTRPNNRLNDLDLRLLKKTNEKEANATIAIAAATSRTANSV